MNEPTAFRAAQITFDVRSALDWPAIGYLYSVAQIANLLSRRLPIGRASANVRRDGTVDPLQDSILRHLPAPRLRQAGSRLAVCATDPRETLNTDPFGRREESLSAL